MRAFKEIEAKHVGKAVFHAFGQTWMVSSFIGRIMPQDVGKRVYLVDGILQVENDEQRDRRSTHVVMRDGEIHYRGSADDCFAYLHRVQGQSVDWACKHEGWSIVPLAQA